MDKQTETEELRRDRHYRRIWNHILWLVRLIIRMRHGNDFKAEPAPPLEGPYLVLPNHANAYDQFFVGCSFPKRHMYFVVSEHAFRQKLVSFLMNTLFSPISRTKGGADASAVRSILRVLRRGASVCLFPEGNRSWDGRTAHLHPATGKLIKLAQVPVMTYRITGGYLTDPRWAHTLRKGPIRGGVVHVYTREEISGLTPEEITARIEADLAVDPEANSLPYPGARLAEGLEEALFLCPKCGKTGTLRSFGQNFSCTCGLHAVYTETGKLKGNIPFSSVAAWDDWQAVRVRELAGSPDLLLEDDDAELRELGEGHAVSVLARGRLLLDRTGLRVEDVSIPLDHMQSPSLCHFGRGETMMLNARGKTYELLFPRPKGVQPPSIRKYQLFLEAMLEGRV